MAKPDEMYAAAVAIDQRNATIEQIELWLNNPYRCNGGELLEKVVVDLLERAKRAENIEIKAIRLADSLARSDVLFPASVAIQLVSFSQELKDSRLRAFDETDKTNSPASGG